jgi:4'-phosphopantetheinyl transferase
MKLQGDAIHVWLTRSDHVSMPAVNELELLLSPEETARAKRFVLEKDRVSYVIARAHLRFVLSKYAKLHPREWLFRRAPMGRPYVANSLPHRLYFSLSHSAGLVATAVSQIEQAGIDVENTLRKCDHLKLARYAFAAAECAGLAILPQADLQSRFFELWTLKEAFAKAKGVGLSVGLDRVSFSIDGERIQSQFSTPFEENPHDWHFELSRPTYCHQFALAVKLRSGRPLERQNMFLDL